MVRRLRGEQGFGLIELLMALTMLNVGILAVVAAFNAGAIALKRASEVSTAASLADAQMELYRSLMYTAVALDDNATKNLTDTTYRGDAVLGGSVQNSVTTTTGCTGSPLPNQCNPSRTAVGADRKRYRIDTFVTWTTPASGRQEKLVTIVVRRPSSPYATLVRQQSIFDESTGL